MTPEQREQLIDSRLQAYLFRHANPNNLDGYDERYQAWVRATEELDLSHMEVYEVEQEARRRFEEGQP